MKKEQREKIVKFAREEVDLDSVEDHLLLAEDNPKIMTAPDAYWVQAWIRVPLEAVKP